MCGVYALCTIPPMVFEIAFIAVLVGLPVGLALGLTGGGGSLLAVPLLMEGGEVIDAAWNGLMDAEAGLVSDEYSSCALAALAV